MEFTTLGRTGLRVSRMGLGCGGHSRLGLRKGNSEQEAKNVVRAALDLGVNFFDTAESYGTEEIVGRALSSVPRESIFISTKAGVDRDERLSTAAEYKARVEACLSRLRTEYVDVFHIHAVSVDEYGYAVEIVVPALQKLKQEGKVRFIGLTENLGGEPAHRMFRLAKSDECWDVVMVGFNLLNQSARDRVFPWTQGAGIGTLEMFAVRRALTDPDLARQVILKLVEEGRVQAAEFDLDDPLGFLTAAGVAESLSEAAYRYCRHEAGIDVVLVGTGNIEHLRENARALSLPALPESVLSRLRKMFAGVDSVAGN